MSTDLAGERTDPGVRSVRATVGVLGGMGPLATAAFYRELTLATRAAIDQDHLPVIVLSEPRVPDRTAFLLGHGVDPRPALLDGATRLRDAGATLLVMPCNSAQAFAPELERAVGVPFVPWLGCAADALAELGRTPVGILATAGTLEMDAYGPPLRDRGLAAVSPTREETDTLMASIYELKATGRVTRASRERVLAVATALHERGARVLVLGCTELPLVVPASSRRWPVPALDPARAVARRTVETAGASVAYRYRGAVR